MCHVILSIPVVGLLLFLFLPWHIALAIYMPLSLFAIFVFFAVIKTMRSPINTGPYAVVGGTAEVVSRLDGMGMARYVIFYQGETRSAISSEALSPGDKVRIISLRGIRPVVAKVEVGDVLA